MKQKLLVLLLLLSALFMIIPQGGETNDAKIASETAVDEVVDDSDVVDVDDVRVPDPVDE